jgi:hypothetical protein
LPGHIRSYGDFTPYDGGLASHQPHGTRPLPFLSKSPPRPRRASLKRPMRPESGCAT